MCLHSAADWLTESGGWLPPSPLGFRYACMLQHNLPGAWAPNQLTSYLQR